MRIRTNEQISDWTERSEDLCAAALRQDLGTFMAKVFSTVSPGDDYLHNWHIDAVTHALMQIHQGKNRRLIITQPPRSLKSICTSVAFVAWSIGHDPSKRFACVSYSHELAASFARQFRAVVTSDWYRALFPAVRLSKDTETECVTTKGGGRFAVPVGGSFTGRGADVIIIDDPMKADDAQSEKARRAVNDWYATTLLSRLDDKQSGAIILVMQRLHEDDLAGRLLREDGWHHLDLPAIAENDQEIPIGPGVVHRRRKGEALHPARESLALLRGDQARDGLAHLLGPVSAAAGPARRQSHQARLDQMVRDRPEPQHWCADRTELGRRKHHRRYAGLVRVHHMADGQTKLLSPRRLARAA